MSFLSDDDVILKYNKTKKLLIVEFDIQPVYDEPFIKTRVKTFEDKVVTKFTCNEIPKENQKKKIILNSILNSAFKLKKKKDIDLSDDELEDPSDESEIEAE